MDEYRMDSHKMMYHVERVNEWLNGENIYPIYVEISPSGSCNHRCTFCATDFMGYKARFLDTGILRNIIKEMGMGGVKSIMYAGEGEPLLHEDIGEIIVSTKNEGIDVALTTNGVFMNRIFVDKTLKYIDWVKISINAGTKKTYSEVHKTTKRDFELVLKNIKYAVDLRNKNDYKTTIGIQIILLPENWEEVELLVRISKDIGVDYLVIKPYSQHLLGNNTAYEHIEYEGYLHLSEILEKNNNDKFNVIFRTDTMKSWDKGQQKYKRCLALPFWSYIDSGGNIYGCSCFLEDDKFKYGNIYEKTFDSIWTGNERKVSLNYVDDMNISGCRINCRMNKINEYLWELKHPVKHVNFI